VTCTHRLADGPLVCTRTTTHAPGHGCVYTSPWLADHHDRKEARDD
jgi:hypothetical protein